MRLSLYIITILLLAACNQNDRSASQNKPSNTNENSSKDITPDSLDTDTSDFITTNFSPAIQDILYISVDRLEGMIHEAYPDPTLKKGDNAPFKKLSARLVAEGLRSHSDNAHFLKKDFNSRLYVEVVNDDAEFVEIRYGMDLWSEGKKYRNYKMIMYPVR